MKYSDLWKQRAQKLKMNIYAIYLASKDPRVPWYARLLAICVAAYAFSPIDLIPDFIPVLGYLDDFILVPLGILLVLKMIPKEVLNEYKEKASEIIKQRKPKNWIAAGIIVIVWVLFVVWITYAIY